MSLKTKLLNALGLSITGECSIELPYSIIELNYRKPIEDFFKKSLNITSVKQISLPSGYKEYKDGTSETFQVITYALPELEEGEHYEKFIKDFIKDNDSMYLFSITLIGSIENNILKEKIWIRCHLYNDANKPVRASNEEIAHERRMARFEKMRNKSKAE